MNGTGVGEERSGMSFELAVIFDMDGVLVDSADAHRRAWQQLGEEVGVPFDAELFRKTFGQRNESIIPAWLGEASASNVSVLGDRKEVLYRALVRQGAIRIYPRIPDLLVELRAAGAGLAVASSGPKENVALLIETIGAFDVIDVAISADDVSEGKPHPAPFLAAASRSGSRAARLRGDRGLGARHRGGEAGRDACGRGAYFDSARRPRRGRRRPHRRRGGGYWCA